jgi:hypothetical protein
LGPHTTGVGRLYLKDLDTIDLSVLEAIVAESYRNITRDTYTLRAREGALRRLTTEPGQWTDSSCPNAHR